MQKLCMPRRRDDMVVVSKLNLRFLQLVRERRNAGQAPDTFVTSPSPPMIRLFPRDIHTGMYHGRGGRYQRREILCNNAAIHSSCSRFQTSLDQRVLPQEREKERRRKDDVGLQSFTTPVLIIHTSSSPKHMNLPRWMERQLLVEVVSSSTTPRAWRPPPPGSWAGSRAHAPRRAPRNTRHS